MPFIIYRFDPWIFSVTALSIFLEGVPFLLIGALVSGLIEIFLTPERVVRYLPSNIFAAILLASFSGLCFPLCECGIVPIAGRLLRKKVPVPVVVAFLFSVPLVNITVIASTSVAFGRMFIVPLLRVAGGIIIATLAGVIVHFIKTDGYITGESGSAYLKDRVVLSGWQITDREPAPEKPSFINKLTQCMDHSVADFFDTSKYFVIGIMIASLVHTMLSPPALMQFSNNLPGSIVSMSLLSYLLCLCSQTDAFIAKTFVMQISTPAIIAFLLSGSMIDLKNTVLLTKIFKPKFIAILLIIMFTLVFFYALAVQKIVPGGLL